MAIIFFPKEHAYKSLDPKEEISWQSVTSVVKKYKRPFADNQALKCSKNKKSKWYGLTPEAIQEIWTAERDRSTTLGDWFHKKQEQALISAVGEVTFKDIPVKICKSDEREEGVKVAGSQKLQDNTLYPEHILYLKSAGICGQSDKIIVTNNTVHVGDFKTSKEIKRKSFTNWEGISAKMLSPLSHLDDCDFNHYALQLSFYMYMVIKHNPNLKPGTLFLEHVVFEKEGETEYGYPILKLQDGDPVIEVVETIELPYLKEEVQTIIKLLSIGK